jgi:single-strand DNA-binding protein
MAAMTVFGVGVATADAELKYVGENKSAVCSVNFAFNRNWKDGQGEWQKEACFMRAQVWGARAERMAELVKKGQPVYVSGYLKQDNWEKDGQKRVAFSISVQDFQLVQKQAKKNDESKGAEPTAAATATQAPTNSDESPEDMPF